MSALTPLYLWYQLKHITGRREREALCICKQGKTRESSTYQGTVRASRCSWALRFAKLLHLLMSNSKLLLCTLCLLCCPEHSHGPAVVSAATLGILACGDLKSLEKAAEMWITGEPQCSHKISARQLFCTACFCRFCPTTPQPAVPFACTCPGTASASVILCKALPHSVCHRGFHTSALCPLQQRLCFPFSDGFAPAIPYLNISQTVASHSSKSVFTACFLPETLLV